MQVYGDWHHIWCYSFNTEAFVKHILTSTKRSTIYTSTNFPHFEE